MFTSQVTVAMGTDEDEEHEKKLLQPKTTLSDYIFLILISSGATQCTVNYVNNF